jgi:uncharacterized protein (TIGR02231 family)
MRTYLLFFALLVSASRIYAVPTPIMAKLQKTTVYLQGAHLYYNENVTLSAGISEFTFENISPGIMVNTIQAGTSIGFVMDIKHKLTYKESPPQTVKRYDKEIKQVLDSIEDMGYLIRENENAASVAAKEKDLLLNNPLMNGKSPKDSLELLKESIAFLKEKLSSILKEELKLEKAHAKLIKKQSDLSSRYQSLILLQNGAQANQQQAKPVNQVIITVFSEGAGTARINFNYLVQNAHWVPQYELAARSSDNKMDLHYFGNVTQNSGIDWKDVPMTLSTFDPTGSNIKPELSPWFLSYLQYRDVIQSNASYPLKEQSLFLGKKAEDDSKENIGNYVAVNDNLLRTEYEIKLKYDIVSGPDNHKVLISKREIPMSLQFAAVPKLSNDAFLMASVTGWEDMNIIPGTARLYFDGAYVGETYLDANTTSDTLKLNLGRDRQITMTRKKVKEKISTRLIGNDKVETRTIEIVVRNTNSQDIDLLLEDQIPVAAATEDIKIKLLGSTDAELEESSGKLTWKFKLKSKEYQKVVFSYEIKYPGDKVVYGL